MGATYIRLQSTCQYLSIHAVGVHFTGGLGKKSAMFSTPDDHQVTQFILRITLRKHTQSLQACTTTECGFSYTKRP